MRDRQMRQWRTLVRERANREWRELSLDVVDELACHLAELQASAIRRGAFDDEARQIALDALNSATFLELSKRPRARHGGGYVHDVRVAIRQLIATPVVTAVAALSLALGIGANTAIFSLVNSLVLRTLPDKDPGQLAILSPQNNGAWTYPIWREVQQQPQLFASAFAWGQERFDLASGGVAEFVDGIWATAGIFDTLGVSPVLGRAFTDADDRPGGGQDGPVAVISYAFWQRRFGGAADTIGRRLTLERTLFTIVGIMPPGFFGPDVGRRVDIVVPIGMVTVLRQNRRLDQRDWWWLSIMMRLRNGQSADQVTATLRAQQPQMRSATLPLDWPAIDRERY